jgi:hypothetical protein
MNFSINPFAESSAAEYIHSDEFVHIFSPAIINSAQELFLPGNVVLKGTPGSGKSMLLTLLKPETQAAYAQSDQDFPIPIEVSKFIGAGINLVRAGAQDIGARLSRNPTAEDKQELATLFGDFVNYYVAQDLLKTVATVISRNDQKLFGLTGVNSKAATSLDTVAAEIASSQCWGKSLDVPKGFSELVKFMERRLQKYRSYFQFSIDKLPEDISRNITSIGEPIAIVAQCLRNANVIDDDTNVFVRIDQLEELYYLEKKFDLGTIFRQVINKALSSRDKRVFYRIGVRGFAWDEQLNVYGSSARLEQDRDFSVVDLDTIFKRSENPETWIFPHLAADVFRRRLVAARFDCDSYDAVETIRFVLGKGNSPERRALAYSGKSPEKTLDFEKKWPSEWRSYIEDLVRKSPLDAKFAEAWARQRGKGDVVMMNFDLSNPPWRDKKKKYWVKERNEQALMQIASKSKSRLIWAGADDIIGLSGGNTLCFITICKHIWQAWLRSPESRAHPNGKLPIIDFSIQATGVYDSSRNWFESIIARGHNGDTRRRLVQMLGIWFNKSMNSDKAMSNPGHNGISLTIDDLESDTEIRRILSFSVDFGDLFEGPHTTKLADKKPRKKWYLSPILCPYFRIPHIRTKEPMYLSISELRKRVAEAEILVSDDLKVMRKEENTAQLSLFSKD